MMISINFKDVKLFLILTFISSMLMSCTASSHLERYTYFSGEYVFKDSKISIRVSLPGTKKTNHIPWVYYRIIEKSPYRVKIEAVVKGINKLKSIELNSVTLSTKTKKEIKIVNSTQRIQISFSEDEEWHEYYQKKYGFKKFKAVFISTKEIELDYNNDKDVNLKINISPPESSKSLRLDIKLQQELIKQKSSYGDAMQKI